MGEEIFAAAAVRAAVSVIFLCACSRSHGSRHHYSLSQGQEFGALFLTVRHMNFQIKKKKEELTDTAHHLAFP
jgi:hypothetical protein